jgi:hypothetical protein
MLLQAGSAARPDERGKKCPGTKSRYQKEKDNAETPSSRRTQRINWAETQARA